MISELHFPMVAPPRFKIVPEERDAKITLRFIGIADMASIERLDEYLREVHAQAMKHLTTAVVVDLRGLEFMNSSCFKCFVEWLGSVQDLPRAERYRVIFESNRALHWQRRSLNALRCFAMDVVTVESR